MKDNTLYNQVVINLKYLQSEFNLGEEKLHKELFEVEDKNKAQIEIYLIYLKELNRKIGFNTEILQSIGREVIKRIDKEINKNKKFDKVVN
jgi:CII-binding regulator of phage lambda lysogenization HflD